MTRLRANSIVRHRKGQVVQGAIWVEGAASSRRRFVTLCTFAEAHIAPDGTDLPDWKPARRLKFLAPLLRAAEAKVAAAAGKPDAAPLIGAVMGQWIELAEGVQRPGTLALYALMRTQYLAAVRKEHPLWRFRPGTQVRAYPKMHADKFRAYLTTKQAEGQRGSKVVPLGRPLSSRTIRKMMATLRTFLNWCVDQELLDLVPRFDLPPLEKKTPRALTLEESADLLARIRAAQDRARAWTPKFAGQKRLRNLQLQERAVLLDMGTGFRQGTIRTRKWSHFDFKRLRVWYGPVPEVGFVEKTHIEGWQPLPRDTAADLKRIRDAAPNEVWFLDGLDAQGRHVIAVGDNWMTRFMGRYLTAMGKGGQGYKSAHVLRRGYITRLHQQGVDLQTAQGLAGHKQASTTQLYNADPDAHQEAAVQQINRAYQRITTPLRIAQGSGKKD